MKKEFRIIGTEVETNKPFESEWCNMVSSEIKIKGEKKEVTTSIEFVELLAKICNQMLKNWQMIFREVEA